MPCILIPCGIILVLNFVYILPLKSKLRVCSLALKRRVVLLEVGHNKYFAYAITHSFIWQQTKLEIKDYLPQRTVATDCVNIINPKKFK